MSKTKKLPNELPPMELDFRIEVRGEVSGKMMTGDFKYRIPNLKAKSLAEKKRAELNAGMDSLIDASVGQLHFMIAYLRFTLVESPEWWSKEDYGYNLYDYNVVKAVFDKVEAFEVDYLKKVWGDSDESQKA